VRVCLVYDCLYPHTPGGAERWYRNLAERLAGAGHDVTYLTLRQWEGADAGVPGVEVIAVGPRFGLYTEDGRRRIWPALRFGFGVLLHLLRRGRGYDVVHTASFPYFSLLAVGAVGPRGGYRLFVDWHEVWTRDYWREYLGRIGGRIGWAIQRWCARIPQRAFCFSRLHQGRLRELGVPDPTVLEGEYDGAGLRPGPEPREPVVVFVGRHIPEKRPGAVVPALARAREQAPELRAEIFGAGPERPRVLAAVSAAGLDGAIEVPGRVDDDGVDDALGRALCLMLPSRREGYGLVVLEAAARGTPSIVVQEPDNAATELVEDGINGVVAASAEPEELARAILRVRAAGPELRASTLDWFKRNERRLSLEQSLETILAAYAG
jgi:glycosyltransferase involved in cell wall biosynthesis